MTDKPSLKKVFNLSIWDYS